MQLVSNTIQTVGTYLPVLCFSHRFPYVFIGDGELGHFKQRLFGSECPLMDVFCDPGGCVSQRRCGCFRTVTRGRGLQQGLRLVALVFGCRGEVPVEAVDQRRQVELYFAVAVLVSELPVCLLGSSLERGQV